MAPRVFFITGTSTGFGQEYVKIAIANGDKVCATARNSSKLEAPEGATKDNYLAVDLDVTKKDQIVAAFTKAFEHFGRIDVVCNNAGYGLSGEFESLSDKQIRTQVLLLFLSLGARDSTTHTARPRWKSTSSASLTALARQWRLCARRTRHRAA